MEELIKLLRKIYKISRALEAHLRKIIRRHNFAKKTLLLNIGETAGSILFIKRGLVRSYTILRGKKISGWLMKEGDIVISVVSFFRQIPSLEAMEALDDCECWGITYEELEETYRLFPEFNIHGRLIQTEYYCLSQELQYSQRSQKAKDKYQYIADKFPDLLLRVQNNHMASYLGISLRTYAYIRKSFVPSKKPNTTRKQ